MKTLRMIYHLALSDYRERIRRYSFLVVMGVIIYLGYLVNTGDFSLKFDRLYRGVYNSAWIGAEVTLVVTFTLSLFGFFLVKNSVEHDTRTGVGQIIATTPLKGLTYLLGKWISHFIILGVMVMMLAAASLVMQLLNREATLDLAALLLPFLVIALPVMALTAGIAVLFESITWLRGSIGNLVYFGIWMITAGQLLNAASSGNFVPYDPLGFGTLIPGARAAFLAQVPDATGYFTLNFKPGAELIPFQWDGITWTPRIIATHSAYFLLAIFLVLVGSLFFERFDPSRNKPINVKDKDDRQAQTDHAITAQNEKLPVEPATRLTPLSRDRNHRAFFGILTAEVRMLVQGRPWWWYVAAVAFVAGCMFVPTPTVAKLLLGAWLWPVLLVSSLGCRERLHETQQLVFSTPRPLWTQLPATWLSGVVLILVLGLGGAIAFLFHSEWSLLASWFSAVLFIPSLALALGVWSGTNKLFEIIFVIWCLGAFQGVPVLDFIHAPANTYLVITVILLGMAVGGRIFQLKK